MIEYKPGMPITAPCYIKNLPADIYHAHDSISNSGLKLIGRSPAHFNQQPKREPTRSMIIGSALHMAVLEPDLFYETYMLLHGCEDRRSKDYKDAKEQFGEEFVLVSSECSKVEGISESLWSKFGELLSLPGHNELSGFVADPETGVMCRHRFDKLTKCGIAIDLKTTVDARSDAFSRSIHTYGYNQQAAFYSDQYEWITGNQLTDFIFIAIESESPYAAKLYRIGSQSLEIGREQYRAALNRYAECKASGFWPGYECANIEEIEVPQYVINKHDFEQIESFVFTED